VAEQLWMTPQELLRARERRSVRALVHEREPGPGERLVVPPGHAVRRGEAAQRAAKANRRLPEVVVRGQAKEGGADVLPVAEFRGSEPRRFESGEECFVLPREAAHHGNLVPWYHAGRQPPLLPCRRLCASHSFRLPGIHIANGPGGPQIVGMPVMLLVEDNADTRGLYASFFGSEGFRVVEAGDGLQALTQLAGEKPDVMLLDLGLPKLNGVQVLRIIRQQPRLADLPVVVVSGQLDLLNAAADIAADVVCPKPCQPEDLMRAVRAVLDRRAMH